MMRPACLSLMGALLCFASAGCGDAGDPGVFQLEPGGPLDGGLDAGMVNPIADASPEPDVMADASSPIGADCVVESALAQDLEEAGERAWSALLHEGSVHLAYVVPTCPAAGGASGTRIDYSTLRPSAWPSAPQVLVSAPEGQCSLVGSPALTVSKAGAIDLYYRGHDENGFELYRRDVARSAAPERITMDADDASDTELLVRSSSFGEGPLLAYVNRRSLISSTQLVTRRPGLPESEIIPVSLGQGITRVALASFPSAPIGGVVGWVSERAQALSIQLQPLDPSGAALGARIDLSTAVGSLSNIALAASEAHAAAVYVVQSGAVGELRYRPLDREGKPSGSEIRLTSADRSVSSPAIAQYANGYAIAFRDVPARADKPATLRVMFIENSGQIGGERRIETAARSGGDAQLIVMNDGRLVVLWSDYEADGSKLRAVRARCL